MISSLVPARLAVAIVWYDMICRSIQEFVVRGIFDVTVRSLFLPVVSPRGKVLLAVLWQLLQMYVYVVHYSNHVFQSAVVLIR